MKALFLIIPIALSNAAQAQETSWGEQFYAQTCATCHGDTAKGDGDLTELLTVIVPDLTTLSQRNDGEFPMLRVIQIIDGRSGMRAHGQPMPLYGSLFRDELQPLGISGAAEPLIRGRVLSIAEFLESIQE